MVATPVTAFTSDNRLDLVTAARWVDFQVLHGAHAVALPMHTGESLNLSLEERQQLAATAVTAAAGRIPVFVHASMPGTDQVVALARHAESVGASAVVVVTPYHWQPSQRALAEHFETVARSVSIDLLADNFQSRLGVTVTTELLVELIERLENFAGVKDARYNMQSFTEACRLTSAARPGFKMFTGVEFLLPSMVVGGAGCFSPCSAVAPRLVADLYEACRDGELRRAADLQHKMSALWHLLRPGYPASVKTAVRLLGRDSGGVRLPLLDLEPDQVARLRDGLEALGVFASEPIGWHDA